MLTSLTPARFNDMTTPGKAMSDSVETQCGSGGKVPQRYRGLISEMMQSGKSVISPTSPLIWRLLGELDEKGI